jgi:hypothetical protein
LGQLIVVGAGLAILTSFRVHQETPAVGQEFEIPD